MLRCYRNFNSVLNRLSDQARIQGGGWGGRLLPGLIEAIQDTPFNSIQAPDYHWVPSSGSNFVSAPADSSVTHKSKQVPELCLISRMLQFVRGQRSQ